MLLAVAKEHNVWVVGGSIPEKTLSAGGGGDAGDAELVYNTAVVAGPDGKVAAVHRKV